MWLSRPISVQRSMTTWEPTWVPAPILTCSPMMV